MGAAVIWAVVQCLSLRCKEGRTEFHRATVPAWCVRTQGGGGDLFFFLPEDHEREVCSGKGCDSTPPPLPGLDPEPRLTDCTILTQNPHAGLSHLLFILIVEFAERPGDDDRAGDA